MVEADNPVTSTVQNGSRFISSPSSAVKKTSSETPRSCNAKKWATEIMEKICLWGVRNECF